MSHPSTVEIGGVTHPVTVPDYATLLDITFQWRRLIMEESDPGGAPDLGAFLWAAIVVLHCPGIKPDVAYTGQPANWLPFARSSYNALAALGRPPQDDLRVAGVALINACYADRFPSTEEVQSRLDFSGAQAERTS